MGRAAKNPSQSETLRNIAEEFIQEKKPDTKFDVKNMPAFDLLLTKERQFHPEYAKELLKRVKDAGIEIDQDVFLFEMAELSKEAIVREYQYGYMMYPDLPPNRYRDFPNDDIFMPNQWSWFVRKKATVLSRFMNIHANHIYMSQRLRDFTGCDKDKLKALRKATTNLFKNLDQHYKYNDLNVPAWAFFTEDLDAVIRRPDIPDLINKLETNLRQAVEENKPCDIWKIFYDHTGGNRFEAIQLMSFIISDISGWMGVTYIANVADEIETLDRETVRKLDYVTKVLMTNQEIDINLYPEDIDVRWSRACYHFHTIAYLANKLMQDYPNDEKEQRAALAATFIYNTEYELLFINLRGKAIGEKIDYFGLNRPIDQYRNKVDIEDMYLGYLGVLEVMPENIRQEITQLSFEEFSDGISKNPVQFVSAIVDEIMG